MFQLEYVDFANVQLKRNFNAMKVIYLMYNIWNIFKGIEYDIENIRSPIRF